MESDLRHIEERHCKEIHQAGYGNVIDFVKRFSESYNAIYRGDRGTLFLVTDFPGESAKNVVIRLTQMPDKSSDYWAIKSASVMRRNYFRRRELLLLRDSPYHTQTPETEIPFSARPRADDQTVVEGTELVKSAARCLPASIPGSPSITPVQENRTMAAELDHLFSYGPLDVVATNDEKARGLHVLHEDAQMSAFIPSDDPLHKELFSLIEKNPHSRGFVANQIQARLEQEGRWAGPALDDEGISFGPSQEVVREPAVGTGNPARDLDSDVEQEATIPELQQRTPLAVGPVMPIEAGVSVAKEPEQPEASAKGMAEPSTEEDLTKDWPGNPAKDAQAPEQKAPESEPVRTFPKKSPPEVLLAEPKRGKALVLDHGDKVSVTNRAMLGIGREAEDRRNKSVEVALKAAKERFGEPVRFSGSRAFEEKTIEMAVRLGIALEPATEHGKRAYEKALEARNALGPSQNRAPVKQKVVEKGIGL
ncbi:LPD7 domain-containing protein [Acidithiobacillus caldus]|uniref:LPD7 domain-containing protein n=1 Tax=Acidithiobacillus caldus TaxID=33059 RepID=UPI001D009A83|nr:LPD7 domain-containing protein [Acidithiobacillus caldus]